MVESVVRRTHIPISQNTFTEDDILAFANEETMVGLVPSIMRLHEEFYVYPFSLPLITNQSYYEIPDRAIGAKVRTCFYQDESQNIQEMTRILPEDIAWWQNRSSVNYPRAFYVENDYLVMVPLINDSPFGQLIVKIFVRPNQLVDTANVCTVTGVNTSTGVVTVSDIPTGFTLAANGLPTLYDFVQTNKAHRLKGFDVPVISINTTLNTITFAPAGMLQPAANLPIPYNIGVPPDLQVGDIVALAGQTNIPQAPDELHPILAQRIACRCLEAQKDTEGLQSAMNKLTEMELALGILIDNRTEGQPQKINNLRSALRYGKFRRRRSTY